MIDVEPPPDPRDVGVGGTGLVTYREGWERPALVAGLRAAGVPDAGWEFLSTSRDRAGFASVELGLFAKVTQPKGTTRMVREAVFARTASAKGLPVVGLAGDVRDQPVIGPLGAATFSPLHHPVAADRVDMAWLGPTLQRLHTTLDLPGLPRWDPRRWFEGYLPEFRKAGNVDPQILDLLAGQTEHALNRAGAATSGAEPVVLHGDVYLDNVVTDGDRLFLVDFELCQKGPREYDLAPTVVLARRFGLPPDRAEELLGAYGNLDRGRLDAMVALAELRITYGVVARYASHHEVFRHELARRVRTLGDRGQARWTPHRDLLTRTTP